MVAKTYICKSLRSLDHRCRTASGKDCLFFSKLAILELCGWIEESMDDVIRRCASRRLKQHDNHAYVESQVIKRTHGFDYRDNFRKMLIQVIGIINVELIEQRVDSAKWSKLTSTLDSLKLVRDTEAHTHIKGVTKMINTPSVTRVQFLDVYYGLKDFERVLKALRWQR